MKFVFFTMLSTSILFAACSGECPECGPGDDTNGSDPNATSSSAEAPYPLQVCVVSGEPLGSMGEPHVHVHEGVTVKFCCKPCLKKFDENPAEFLAKLKQ